MNRRSFCSVLIAVAILPALVLAQDIPTTAPAGARAGRGRGAPRKPIDPNLPTLWIIGDSTVKNGADTGDNGQWGWGNPIRYYFDETKINVQNRAVGGTSSRSFQDTHWPWILKEIKPGDYVIMQFGHNDAGTPKGNGNELVAVPRRGFGRGAASQPATSAPAQMDMLHSFGWYMRKYVTDAGERGAAMSIICTPIPRNRWNESGTIAPDAWDQTCKEAAEMSGAKFIDLNALIIKKYSALGKDKVTAELFPQGEAVHTDWAGAILNAESVIDGLKSIDSPLVKYLKPSPPTGLINPWGKAR
jgi:lysophospholipase L1-like esterase